MEKTISRPSQTRFKTAGRSDAAADALKIPPHSEEAERSVLGGVMLNNAAWDEVIERVREEDFYNHQHRLIFRAMLQLASRNNPIDILTVTEALKTIEGFDMGDYGGYLLRLLNETPSIANIVAYAEVVRDRSVLRQLIQVSNDVAGTAFSPEGRTSVELLDEAERKIFAIAEQGTKANGPILISNLAAKAVERIDSLFHSGQTLTGLSTGYVDIDKKTAGLQHSELIIVAARPSMGKCVTGDTEILNPTTGQLISIQEMVEKSDGELLTLQENWKINKTKPTHFVSDGLKPTFRVRTALGHEIEATYVHPLLTLNGWKKVGELQIGDRIAAARVLPYFGEHSWPEHQIKALAYFIADGSLSGLTPKFTNANPVIIQDFQESMQKFSPCIQVPGVQDIRSSAKNFSATVNKAEYQEARQGWAANFSHYLRSQENEVRSAVRALGIPISNINHWQNGVSQPSAQRFGQLQAVLEDLPVPEYFYRENPVTEFLKEQGVWGKTAGEKTIPAEVFTLVKANIALFLSCLYACDGTACVSMCGGREVPLISYCSISKKLAQQVQHLLLRFGILAKVRTKAVKYKDTRRTAYEVEIHDAQGISTFAKEIGIFGKEEAIARVVSVAAKHRKGWTKDTVPIEIWPLIQKARGQRSWASIYKQLGMPVTHNIHAGKRSPRRETVLKLGRALDSQELIDIASSDVYWDPIISIEATGEKPVYDLTVADTHNFIANNLVVHNTAFALNIAEHAAISEKKLVLLFSMEMSAESLATRMFSSLGRIPLNKLRTGQLTDEDWPRIASASGLLGEARLFIDDTPALNPNEMRARARRLAKDHGQLGLIVIDYLQLMQVPGLRENRVAEISEISRSLKVLAKELKVPVIALSQLNRSLEQRPNKRPVMSDLRDSGAIEQDADLIMFIYRDEVYNPETPDKGTAEIIIAKQRDGETGMTSLTFLGQYTRFESRASNQYQ